MKRLKKRYFRVIGIFVLIAIFILGYKLFLTVYQKVDTEKDQIQAYQRVYNYYFSETKPITTLVLLMNNAEQRFGGGFIGTVFSVKTQSQSVQPNPVRSSYYFDRVLENEPTLMPVPLELSERMLAKRVLLRDSANYVNFADSAKIATQIYEKETNESVESVVAFTPEVLKSLLTITGPIYLESYNLTVSSDNFNKTLQIEVEGGVDKANNQDPKTIIGNLAAEVIEKLLKQDFTQLAAHKDIFTQLATRKQIMFYAENSSIEKDLNFLQLSGNISEEQGNFLMVANSNVGADKSSQYIDQKVTQRLFINPNDKAEAEITIERKHRLDKPSFLYYEPREKINKYLVGDMNINYTKVLVPKGSQLIDSSTQWPVRQFDEADKTAFVFENSTKVGTSSQVRLKYRLPYRFQMTDPLVIPTLYQKQNGSYPSVFELYVKLPPEYTHEQAEAGILVYNGKVDTDLRLEKRYDR